MRTLVELVEQFGEAIESDLSRVHGDSLRDFLMGRRPAGEALRKIRMLPPGSATAAQMADATRSNGAVAAAQPAPRPESWRSYYGIDPTVDAMWDLWDAVVATAQQGKKGRNPPTHPRTTPPKSNRGRPNAATATGTHT